MVVTKNSAKIPRRANTHFLAMYLQRVQSKETFLLNNLKSSWAKRHDHEFVPCVVIIAIASCNPVINGFVLRCVAQLLTDGLTDGLKHDISVSQHPSDYINIYLYFYELYDGNIDAC